MSSQWMFRLNEILTSDSPPSVYQLAPNPIIELSYNFGKLKTICPKVQIRINDLGRSHSFKRIITDKNLNDATKRHGALQKMTPDLMLLV